MDPDSRSSESIPTKFLPGERAPAEEIRRQCALISRASNLTQALEMVNEIVVFLNQHRQVVYANKAALNYFKFHNGDIHPGARWGEALNCAHSHESPGGCGTTQFCRTCGAAKATWAAQSGREDIKECRIIQDGTGDAFDFKVATGRLKLEGEPFTVFCAMDISDQKRKAALERIFFHDILNTAGGLYVISDMLPEATPDERQYFQRALSRISKDIVEQIQAQRDLAMAESNDLTPCLREADALSVLQDAMMAVKSLKGDKSQCARIASESQSARMITDATLLRRVLVNMIKNAVEACGPGQAVTAGVHEIAGEIEFWVHNPGVMSADVQLQIFQRSFSTKGVGRGLGTYSMQLLSERYLHGSVSFASDATAGTQFVARFPAAPQRPQAPGTTSSK